MRQCAGMFRAETFAAATASYYDRSLLESLESASGRLPESSEIKRNWENRDETVVVGYSCQFGERRRIC